MFRNIKEEDFEELTKLYKYDLELFDYDPHMYWEIINRTKLSKQAGAELCQAQTSLR